MQRFIIIIPLSVCVGKQSSVELVAVRYVAQYGHEDADAEHDVLGTMAAENVHYADMDYDSHVANAQVAYEKPSPFGTFEE